MLHKKRTTALAAAVILILTLAGAGCDSQVISREPIEGPPPTEAPTESPETEAPATATPSPTPLPTPEPTMQPTPDPTPEPTPEPTTVELTEGMQAPEVYALQQRLRELGYLRLGEDELTDYFGPATRRAVELFQRQNALDADGIAGEGTLALLNSPDAKVCELPLSGVVIGLDPGHQAHGNNEQEPIAPGSSETKPKVSSGTAGVATGVNEYEVNLAVGLRLRELLQNLGAEVLMTRDTNDVNISNAQRAQMMNDAGVDLVVRLHCDGEDDSSRNGAFILIPVGQYTTGIQQESRNAAEAVLAAFVETTGANNLGLSERDDQTGFNWSTVPVINIEMGHMSNPAEDQRLVSEDYQQLCAEGIALGLENYFA